MIKKIIVVTFCLIVVISGVITPASAFTPTTFDVDAEGALLINIDTEDVIFSKNINTKLYPASLTKLLTALILYENTSNLDTEIITVSENAIKLLQGTDSSVGGLKPGEQLTVRQMLYVLLLSSANDGANAIAEHVAGDIDSFIVMMNEKAASLNMTGSHFVNAHGLHDHQHYTTINDMYLLTRAFLAIDVLKEISYTKKYTLEATNKNPKRTFTTTNFLLLNNGQKCTDDKYKGQEYYYKYANGVKTGYTDNAGRCLISTASKNGYNYLCILMNSPVYNSRGQKIRIEFGDTKKLYEWAFTDFAYKTVLESGQIVGEAPLELAWDTDNITAMPAQSLSAIVPKVADTSTITLDIKWDKESYDAPIKKGNVLGKCDVIYAGEVLGTVDLVASKDVERSFIMYIGRSVKNFFTSVVSSLPFLITVAVILVVIIVFIIICIVMNSPKHRKRKKY